MSQGKSRSASECIQCSTKHQIKEHSDHSTLCLLDNCHDCHHLLNKTKEAGQTSSTNWCTNKLFLHSFPVMLLKPQVMRSSLWTVDDLTLWDTEIWVKADHTHLTYLDSCCPTRRLEICLEPKSLKSTEWDDVCFLLSLFSHLPH